MERPQFSEPAHTFSNAVLAVHHFDNEWPQNAQDVSFFTLW
jgi:hypothetical protein